MGSNNYSVPLEQGAPFVLRPADPIVGASFSILVPNHVRWELLYVQFQLITAPAGGARMVIFQLDDATGAFLIWEQNATQAASMGLSYHFVPGDGNAAATIGQRRYGVFPRNLILLPNTTIHFAIDAINPSDVVSNVFIHARRWAERNV